MVYIFAADYDTAAKVANDHGLGRIRWQFVASKYTIMGRHNLRVWTCEPGLTGHPQFMSVSGQISALRADGELVEDRTVIVPGKEAE